MFSKLNGIKANIIDKSENADISTLDENLREHTHEATGINTVKNMRILLSSRNELDSDSTIVI